ncbi:MAG TPA: hypothetical protein PKC98_07830 [Candidatus Melainabacteria bacterium]|nr:hypothetical protein [Candidatus Melainabacteria bacterium]
MKVVCLISRKCVDECSSLCVFDASAKESPGSEAISGRAGHMAIIEVMTVRRLNILATPESLAIIKEEFDPVLTL